MEPRWQRLTGRAGETATANSAAVRHGAATGRALRFLFLSASAGSVLGVPAVKFYGCNRVGPSRGVGGGGDGRRRCARTRRVRVAAAASRGRAKIRDLRGST